MIESKYKTPLSKRPDISQMIVDGHISSIEMKIGEALQLVGIPIIRQLLIYNPNHPDYPFSADIYLPTKDAIIEANGKQHYTDRGKERDQRKTIAINDTGVRRTLMLDVQQPRELLYWHLQGEMRAKMKQLNDTYYQGLIWQAVQWATQLPNITKLQTPRIWKSKT
jgi:hypothetical protein